MFLLSNLCLYFIVIMWIQHALLPYRINDFHFHFHVTKCWRHCLRPRCSHYSASRMQLLDWCRYDHFTPTLIQLYWLQVSYSSCAASSTPSTTVAARRMWNSPVSRRQQITLRAGPAIWKALPDNIHTVADPVKFRKLLKSHCFIPAFNSCWFFCFSRCFSIWLTFAMHLWSRFS